ncbi:DUF3349 domain-containing protein [Pseudanabaenaceae cyanobacterium LEGE 13415]|nr:DUF3349 domain-containing protein [Pseudanabaenaceae cyanobacterium LEGE 13415]
MQKTIPAYLASTYQLLQSAFPQGIENQDYLPLLVLLHDQMSDRSLAQVIAEFVGRDYPAVLNDVYGINAASVARESLENVKQKLIRGGYENWLLEG